MKKFISWALMFVIFSFVVALFSSFVATDEIIVYLDADSFVLFSRKTGRLLRSLFPKVPHFYRANLKESFKPLFYCG